MSDTMRKLLDFDDAGAGDDHPARGVTVGDIRRWYDESERRRAALAAGTTELENLFAMIQGEAPSLLEDHFSYMNIVAAIKTANDTLTHEQSKEQ